MRRWALALLVAACGQDAPDSHQRMLDLLAKVRDDTADTNMWLGDKRARGLRARLETLGSSASRHVRCLIHVELGYAEMVLGNEDASIEQLQQGMRIWEEMAALKQTSDGIPPLSEIRFVLGVANMRLGETQNCCARNSPDSCILPIRGSGIHTRQEGSRRGIQAFGEILRTTTPQSALHLRSLWLLNIAHMTLGTYPESVPREHRIPPAAFESTEPFPRFVNVARAKGLDTFSLSGGAVAEDFDNDGDIDLLVSTWDTAGPMKYFVNRGDGTFDERSQQAGLRGLLGGLNMVQADYDNDGDVDVFVLRGAWLGEAGQHPNSLLSYEDGRFTDVTFDAGLGKAHYPTQTAAWADYDNDGDVDLYVGNEYSLELRYNRTDTSGSGLAASSQLFRNNGDGTFTDVAKRARVINNRWSKAVTWGDYDGDRFPDLFVSNLGGKNRLYHNNGDGTFTSVAVELGVAGPNASFPAWFWDFDNDGHLDLFVSAYQAKIGDLAAAYMGRQPNLELAAVYKGDGKGRFKDVARAMGLTRPTTPMGSNFGDLDNDGYLDFYLGTGDPLVENIMPNAMYRNKGGTAFVDVTIPGGFGHLQKGHAIVFADFDGDGDQDVFEQLGGAFPCDRFYDALFLNPGFGNHWIKVRLVGTKSNRSAIGARIRVVAGGRSIYRHVNSGGTFGANPLMQTIGLGKADRVERIEVFWPTTGRTQVLEDLPVNEFVRIVEAD